MGERHNGPIRVSNAGDTGHVLVRCWWTCGSMWTIVKLPDMGKDGQCGQRGGEDNEIRKQRGAIESNGTTFQRQ